MSHTSLHFSNDCPNCHGTGYTVQYSDDHPSAVCTWCNRSKAHPPSMNLKQQQHTHWNTTASPLRSCYPGMQGTNNNNNNNEGWNMLPMTAGRSPGMIPYPVENRSFPSTPGSATDLSPSTNYSEGQGYFDFIPIQNNHYDHPAPISPGSLSVPGSDNDTVADPPSLSPTSRTQSQRDSKARCLKKLDNAMEKLINILPNEMQLSCKRGRANGLKLVEEYIVRIISENTQLRAESKKFSGERDHAVTENKKLREELAKLRHALQQNQY